MFTRKLNEIITIKMQEEGLTSTDLGKRGAQSSVNSL
jgi:hypothetical protein